MGWGTTGLAGGREGVANGIVLPFQKSGWKAKLLTAALESLSSNVL